MKKITEKYLVHILIGLLVLILAVAGAGGYFIYSLTGQITSVKTGLSSSVADLDEKIKNLQSGLEIVAKTNEELSSNLQAQQSQSSALGQTLNGLAGTVGTLEKLSKTDRELLQKYSKVYFLNENYVPVQLSNVDPKYLYNKNANVQFHSVVMPFLTKMLDEANANVETTLQITSAYRSFGTQTAIKINDLMRYGSGANAFSADQGYSEHQLGTTIDLTTPNLTPVLDIKFESTPASVWLTNNAYKFGFILSYPRNNSYYQYEPWHWRFTGIELATKLHNENKYFYDLDQREIDAYLTKIFDQITL